MGKKHSLSMFIFRRDFRIVDNTGLNEALANSAKVIPVFIFTDKQINKSKNSFKSEKQVKFMVDCLKDLDSVLRNHGSKLYIFHGKPEEIVKKLSDKVDAVYVNEDYTPYSIKRDNLIKDVCEKNIISFVSCLDYLLNPPGSVLTDAGNIYNKFTPFYNKASQYGNYPKKYKYTNYFKGKLEIHTIPITKINKYYKLSKNEISNILKVGSRNNALSILKKLCDYKNYNKQRNDLSYSTTHLSAYIKFGCVSIREVMNKIETKLGNDNDLMKQLYWREFYYNIMIYYPHVINGKNRNFKKKYKKVPWKKKSNTSPKQQQMFSCWKKGNTGFPIVDACMRELNTTGYMHNRGRLIVASFLTKNMLWHWEEGEKYFATKLIDYDPAVNNGNWQWCSGSGVDSQPYFRIFNPWTQGKRNDPNANYIKKWVPELSTVPAVEIHKWDSSYEKYPNIKYSKPMLNHKKSSLYAKKMFKKAL